MTRDYEQTTGHVITCTAGFTDICDCPQQPASAPVTVQDTPGGFGQPTDGPETPQTAVKRLQRLRAQLAAEHAKAVAADQHPRPDLDHLRVTAHNGIAAGLETAIFFVDHHLREAGEEARTTPDNPATSSDTADNPLRQQYAATIGTVWDGWIDAWVDVDVSDPEGTLADAVLAVRDRELERLEKLHQAHLRVEARLAGQSLVAEAAVERIRRLIAAHRPRLRLADPVLLGKLDRVLEQPAELEPAQAGEQSSA